MQEEESFNPAAPPRTSKSHWSALATEADRLRLFISSVTDYAIFMLSPEGRVVSWNAGAQRFKGYSAREIIGQHFSRFYTPEDRASGLPERALATACELGKFEAEGWRVRKDGSQFWASVVIDPIRDEQGELLGFAKITRDITEKKQTELALRESEERFRILVQGVTDYAICMLSPDGIITNWNAGARRIKGYEEHEVVGTHFSRFYTEEDRASDLPRWALAQAVEIGRFEAEGWRVRKDGSRFWAHVVLDPIRDELGKLVGFAKITRDITDRKNAATALEQTREALFRSQKLETIGQLTGGVAHDFNNLLNVMASGIHMLRKHVRDPADVRMLDAMDQASSRGALLTRQLLSFARQQPLRPEPRDLNRLIESFTPVLVRGSRKAIEFGLKLAPELALAMVDTAQFESALLNLVVNARDATPDGGRITVATRPAELREREVGLLPAGAYVAVSVQDSGAGMAPDVAQRAVEPFFTTKAEGKGTGLGLSQVYGMTQQSGGDLQIESRVGHGTTITLFLPALSEGAAVGEDDAVAQDEAVPLDTPATATSLTKALIVDDKPEVLEVTSELFRSLGFEVLAADSGKRALELLAQTPGVRLILSDFSMPEMNGIQLGRKAQEMVPGVRVILASGYAKAAMGADARKLQGLHLLPKPYRVEELVKLLRELALD